MTWLSSLRSTFGLAESQPHPDTRERGDSAISYQASSRNAERALRELDHSYEWRSSNKWKLCDRMRKSDPKIYGLRKAQSLPLVRAEVSITGSEDEEKVEFIRKTLLEDFPWRSFLEDVLLYPDFGFSAFALNWRADNDRKWRIDELRYLPPRSIRAENIFVRRGRLERVVQTPDTGGEFEVDGSYLLWFAHDKEGDDFIGRPILRAMHKPWYTKERLEVLLPILIEKAGGIPLFTEKQPLDTATRAAVDAMGEAFTLGERSYIRVPDDVGVELLESKATAQDILEAIRYFDTQLTNVCQAQYLDLGINQAGSRAYGSTLADMFSDAVQAQASYIEDVLNARDGIIHQLIAYNFPTDDDLPQLRFSDVGHTDVVAFAASLRNLQQSGLLTPDAPLEDFIRDKLNLPERDDTQVVVPGVPAPPSTDDGETPPAEETPDETGAQASEHASHGHSLTLAERRQPRGPECYVALDELTARFDDGKTAVRDATEAIRTKLVVELVNRARSAAEKGTLDRFLTAAPPMVDGLAAEIAPVMASFYRSGREQVSDELKRQRDGEPVVEEIVSDRVAPPTQGAQMLAAETPRKRKRSPVDEAEIARQADIAARTIAVETLAAAAAVAARGVFADMSAAAMAALVQRESDASALRMGATVTNLMQVGRADEAAANAEDIAYASYSAILDGNVCEECEPMDGEETEDLAEAESWTPNPNCLGGGNCRCVTIYVYRQEGSR